jgi:hypothetical protein
MMVAEEADLGCVDASAPGYRRISKVEDALDDRMKELLFEALNAVEGDRLNKSSCENWNKWVSDILSRTFEDLDDEEKGNGHD